MSPTNVEWYRDALGTAYAAMDGDSNDAEHDALVGLVEVVTVRSAEKLAEQRDVQPSYTRVPRITRATHFFAVSSSIAITAPFPPSIAQRVRPEAPLNPQSLLLRQ